MDPWAVIATIFVIIALVSSFQLITKHLVYYNKPYLQKYIVRILWMVPIYSINSWVALVLPGAGVYLDVLRETYEAFVIYSFMKYLFNYLHYDLNIQQNIDFKQGVQHTFPFCFLGSSSSGRTFLNRCRQGILQYVVVRPSTTILAVLCQLGDRYGEGQFFNLRMAYPYLLIVNNVSQIVAMYCLFIFYKSYKSELSEIKPLPKFLCIKLVVFASFFQSVIISFIVYFSDGDDHLARSRRIQEILICIEMVFASLAHHYAYSYEPFLESPLQDARESCCFAFLRTLDFTDERNEVTDHLYQVMLQFRKKFKYSRSLPSVVTLDRNNDDGHEYTPLNNLNLTKAGSSKSSYSVLPSVI